MMIEIDGRGLFLFADWYIIIDILIIRLNIAGNIYILFYNI